MKHLLLLGVLALLLASVGCAGYYRGYHPSYSSPGCYSCSRARHYDEGYHSRHHRDHDRDGGHHHDHDRVRDDHHRHH